MLKEHISGPQPPPIAWTCFVIPKLSSLFEMYLKINLFCICLLFNDSCLEWMSVINSYHLITCIFPLKICFFNRFLKFAMLTLSLCYHKNRSYSTYTYLFQFVTRLNFPRILKNQFYTVFTVPMLTMHVNDACKTSLPYL